MEAQLKKQEIIKEDQLINIIDKKIYDELKKLGECIDELRGKRK